MYYENCETNLIWVPSYMDVPENKQADQLARSTPTSVPYFHHIPHTDILSQLGKVYTQIWTFITPLFLYVASVSNTTAFWQTLQNLFVTSLHSSPNQLP